MTDITVGILGGLGSGLTWASSSILVRSLSGSYGVAGVNALRSLVGGGLLLAVAFATGHGAEIMRAPLWAVLSLGTSIVIALAIGDTLFFASTEYLGVTRALTIGIANPVLTTIFGIAVFGEAITPIRGSGIVCVLCGLFLIVTGREAGERRAPARLPRGLRLAGLAAISWSVSAILLRQPLQILSALSATAIRIPFGGLVLSLTPWVRGTIGLLRQSGSRDRAMLAIACLLAAVGPLLFSVAVKSGGVAVATVLSGTAPLFSIPMELLLYGQPPSRPMILGALVTTLGVGLMRV